MSKTILADFIRQVEEKKLEVLGIEVYRDGERIACHRWEEEQPVNIWSHTKCFVSAAVGMAIDDGKLSLGDRIAESFPEYVPKNADPRLYDVTLRHLLTMSSGQKSMLLFGPMRDDSHVQLAELPKDEQGNPCDLLARILAEPFAEAPGLSFSYSNGDADLAARMVEHAVGMTVQNYLTFRLFEPLGIGRPEWESDLRGHSYGDAGLYLKTSDMAKLGLLYSMDGIWEGKRLISSSWIAASTAKQIDTPVRDAWDCGYGYLIWKFPLDDGYRFAGIGGQNTIVLPKRRIVIALNARVGARLPELKRNLDATVLDAVG